MVGLTGCITLVGVDLDDFRYDCGVSDNCTIEDYSEYDGYAIVITFFDAKTSFLT